VHTHYAKAAQYYVKRTLTVVLVLSPVVHVVTTGLERVIDMRMRFVKSHTAKLRVCRNMVVAIETYLPWTVT
jgi:hypothetical protein